MKTTNLTLIVLLFFLYFNANAQYNPTIGIKSNTNGLVKYDIKNAGQGTHIFTLFDNGMYSISNTPIHKFDSTSTGHVTESYFARPYRPIKPKRVTQSTGSIGYGSNYVNSSKKMVGEIDLSSSWSTSKFSAFYIIAFKNTSSTLPVSGCIEFKYNTNEVSVNASGTKEYNNWVTNRTITSTTGKFNKIMKWGFSNLKHNEIRYIYVPAKAITKVGAKINLEAVYKVNCTGSGSASNGGSGGFLVRRYPHDPNFKIVNDGCLKPQLDSQSLEYTIGYYNDGNNFARDVFIEDPLSNFLIPQSAVLIDSEYPPTHFNIIANVLNPPTNVNAVDSLLQIDFSDIYLPGTQQVNANNEFYSYEDASTYFTFKICTMPDLQLGECIYNMAEIRFDNQPIFYTNHTETCILTSEGNCKPYDICNSFSRTQSSIPIKNEAVNDWFKVHPNPFRNEIKLSVDFNKKEHSNFTIKILDSSGKIIEDIVNTSKKAEVYNKTFNLEYLSKGLYFIILETEDGTVHAKKIMKF